ncbi:MAG: hypothetical protein RLZZ40_472 [Actinomycetota bacterium]
MAEFDNKLLTVISRQFGTNLNPTQRGRAVESLNAAGIDAGRNRDALRQHNLSLILKLVHTNGSVSRSQLTTATGLNRSTILNLVNDLAERKLIISSESDSPTGVGRPSHVVSPSPEVVAFAVHPEFDSTTVGVVTLGGRVLARRREPLHSAPTPEKSVAEAARLVSELRMELPKGTRIAGIGVTVPGQVRGTDGVVRLAPHLGWVEVPLATMLTQATGLPVTIDNDASIGCMAEYTFGSARGFENTVYLYAGSGGIGGGVIVDGVQLRGVAGYAGELGHVRISSSPGQDYSGLSGTIESLVQRDSLLESLKLYGATDEELEVEILTSRSDAVRQLLHEQIDALGAGLGNFVNIFNPNAIVLDGFLAALFKYDEGRLLNRIRESSLAASSERLIIRAGELGSNLLMIGGAELAFGSLLNDPAEAVLANR